MFSFDTCRTMITEISIKQENKTHHVLQKGMQLDCDTFKFLVFMSRKSVKQPSPRVTLGEIFSHSFVYNILSTVYMRWARQLGRARQLGEASCLASAGRVTLAGETTFSHVNSLARLPETRQQSLKCARIK